MPPVSLIATLREEEESIGDFLCALAAQTRPADEIVLVDGGSSDRTVEIVRQWLGRLPLRLEIAPGANRSRGRNLAISLATHDIIAAIDAGCQPRPDWLEQIVAPFDRPDPPDVVAGYYEPVGDTPFARAVGAATVPRAEEVDPKTVLPSSRSVAFTRAAWKAVGGYPEDSAFNEDTQFDVALRKAGFRFVFRPQARVRWEVQRTPAGLFRQFYRYARGDSSSGLNFGHYPKSIAIVLLTVLLLALTAVRWAAGVLLIAAALLYGLRYFVRSRRRGADVPAALLSPAAAYVVDLAHFIGYLRGRFERGRQARA